MRKWLKSPWGKVLGIALSALSAAGLVVSLLWAGAVSSMEVTDLLLDGGKNSFLESATFRSLLREHIYEELRFYGESLALGASGEVNRETLVDIGDFGNEGKITGKNVNGLAYTLGDLLDWQKKRAEETSVFGKKGIVACEMPYGGARYYYVQDMIQQLKDGELTMEWEDGRRSSDLRQLLESWGSTYEGTIYEAPTWEYPDQVVDKDGNVAFVSMWLYDGYAIEELYAPQGADSLLEVVNEKQWDLEDTFYALDATLDQLPERIEEFKSNKRSRDQETNIQYLYVDLDAKQAFSNKPELAGFKSWKNNLEKFRQMGGYALFTEGFEGETYDSNLNSSEDSWRHWVDRCLADTVLGDSNYAFAVGVDTDFSVPDWLYAEREAFQRNIGILKKAIGGGVASAVLFLLSLVWLTVSAGRSAKKDKIALNFFDLWKTELAAVLVTIVWVCLLGFFLDTGILDSSILTKYLQLLSGNGHLSGVQMRFYLLLAAALAVGVDLFFLWGYLSLVRRVKARTLWKNSVLRSLLRIGKRTVWRRVKDAFFALKDIPRKAVALVAFLSIEIFLVLCLANFSYGGGFLFFLLLLIQAAGIGWIVKVAVEYQKIQKGVKKIAGGDITGQIPTQGLTFDRKTLAQDINRIGEGLDNAVEESLRSERLKTELITNVSHDIKTPLTSIINYVDLLKREEFSDEKVQGYLEILEKKSQQLKTLTEDVVEASKASTGNLKLEYEDLNLAEMIRQVNGEFQEKFSQQDLDLIQRLPETAAVIRADGRRVWRILENIYQNVYKYAMPHTRVYVELEADSLHAVFTMKNISRQPLNISADELTERFIRGDSSRNTQGSGLGLSIAKSLTELQDGEFQLYLDGDLFKVWIAFPLLR